MPKDREKYRYFDVGLERDSWALAQFEEDARKHQMSEQPGKLITLRLTEYYEQKERERQSPWVPPAFTRNNFLLTGNISKRSNDSSQPLEEDLLNVSHHEMENADEAADYWAQIEM